MPRAPSKVRAPTQALTRTYISLPKATNQGEKYTVKIVSDKGQTASQCTKRELKTAIGCARKKAGIRN
jgi:predicted AlkP superfamily pyrophosphatase or phosphodiesterase